MDKTSGMAKFLSRKSIPGDVTVMVGRGYDRASNQDSVPEAGIRAAGFQEIRSASIYSGRGPHQRQIGQKSRVLLLIQRVTTNREKVNQDAKSLSDLDLPDSKQGDHFIGYRESHVHANTVRDSLLLLCTPVPLISKQAYFSLISQ
ncbi:hypothetical protein PG993_014623 [Apiospora rasikravindrae]|uniref:Uncharacterized protein n=1 Tax=Apiospora rasikravindrae TaxID=990691 RepID=A0ABR1RN98_9PEZI